jgi:hypothetical protein
MRTKNTIWIIFTTLLFISLLINWTSAYQWNWTWPWTWTWTWNWNWTWSWTWFNANLIDTNTNWIADWREDWDSDWVLNKDDEDYIKLQQENKKSYKAERSIELKNKLWKKSNIVDDFMWKASKVYANINNEEKKTKYNNLLIKIDKTTEKLNNLNISEYKKEAYRNILEYLRLQTETELESIIID